MDCPHKYDFAGMRSFSDHLPPNCWGAYMPGDEPGIYCNLTDWPCSDPDGNYPADCEEQERLFRLCPECGETLYKNGRGIIYCLECGHEDDKDVL